MKNKPKFKPNQWAVLRHSAGGRLFHVDHSECRQSRDGEIWYRVFEKKQHPWAGTFDVWERNLIKCRNKQQCELLVACFKRAHDIYKDEINQAKSRFENALDTLTKKFKFD